MDKIAFLNNFDIDKYYTKKENKKNKSPINPYNQVSYDVYKNMDSKNAGFFTSSIINKKIENNKPDSIEDTIRKNDKQVLDIDTYFIKMLHYAQNLKWAKDINNLTYIASTSILENDDFEDILNIIENGVAYASRDFGMSDWYSKKRQYPHTFPILCGARGEEYLNRYKLHLKNNDEYKPKANKEYKDANINKITTKSKNGIGEVFIIHDAPREDKINNIELIKKEFEKLRRIENPTSYEINRSCAIIKWLFSQETPYDRGSDAISNVLIRAIQHAYNIKISPLKDGISLDFEAFDTDLDDYIARFPYFFKQLPLKIDPKYENYGELTQAAINYLIENKKQYVGPNTFQIRLNSYPHNECKLGAMNILLYITSMLISQGADSEDIFRVIEKEIRNINKDSKYSDLFSKKKTKIHLFEILPHTRGMEYYYRYIMELPFDTGENKLRPKSNKEYKDANTCIITEADSNQGYSKKIRIINRLPQEDRLSNLNFAKQELDKLRKIQNPTEDEINKACATIQWLISQEIPYYRGSDSIANIITRAIYHCYDMKISPQKEGISLDFEAFDTDLDDYIKKYPTFFEEYPHKLK